MVTFDSNSLIINPSPYEFGEGLLPPTEAIRTRDDQPSPEDSLEWYRNEEDPSDPADWSDEEVEEMYQDWLAIEGHGGFCGHHA